MSFAAALLEVECSETTTVQSLSLTAAAAEPRASDSTDDEPALVLAAQAGQAEAFEALVTRYEKRIYRLAWNITQNRSDAEDVVQDAFLKAFQHLGTFQGHSRFYTWLVRIAVNQALMKLRKRRHTEISIDDPIETEDAFLPRELKSWGPTPEEHFGQRELNRILTAAIAELDCRLRVVFQLRDIEGLSTEQTADALGLTIPATKTRLLRARLKLRDKLHKHFRSSLPGQRESRVSRGSTRPVRQLGTRAIHA